MTALSLDASYFDLVVQLREHADAFNAEAQRFLDRMEVDNKAGTPRNPVFMHFWDKRMRSWLCAFDAYLPVADRFAAAGAPGMLAYVAALKEWVLMTKLDDDDLGSDNPGNAKS